MAVDAMIVWCYLTLGLEDNKNPAFRLPLNILLKVCGVI